MVNGALPQRDLDTRWKGLGPLDIAVELEAWHGGGSRCRTDFAGSACPDASAGLPSTLNHGTEEVLVAETRSCCINE